MTEWRLVPSSLRVPIIIASASLASARIDTGSGYNGVEVIIMETNRLLGITSALLIMVGSSSCGLFGVRDAKQPLTASAGNTSGEGTVQAEVGNNGNTDIELRVKHLSEPSKVESDSSVYVVWLKPHDAAIQNLGALVVDDDLVGRFDTTTPHRAFRLSVTPEPSARMNAPSHAAVFTSEVAVAEK